MQVLGQSQFARRGSHALARPIGLAGTARRAVRMDVNLPEHHDPVSSFAAASRIELKVS